jgi:hypothetical protein
MSLESCETLNSLRNPKVRGANPKFVAEFQASLRSFGFPGEPATFVMTLKVRCERNSKDADET